MVYSQVLISTFHVINDLWWHKDESSLAYVRTCCLAAPSHWLIINKVLWHSSEGIIWETSGDISVLNKIENSILKHVQISQGFNDSSWEVSCWLQ